MPYMIFYDITQNRKRTRIAKKLIQEGYERLQYSVFTGWDNPLKNKMLMEFLENQYDRGEYPNDKIFIINIPADAVMEMKVIGKLAEDLAYLAGKCHTTII